MRPVLTDVPTRKADPELGQGRGSLPYGPGEIVLPGGRQRQLDAATRDRVMKELNEHPDVLQLRDQLAAAIRAALPAPEDAPGPVLPEEIPDISDLPARDQEEIRRFVAQAANTWKGGMAGAGRSAPAREDARAEPARRTEADDVLWTVEDALAYMRSVGTAEPFSKTYPLLGDVGVASFQTLTSTAAAECRDAVLRRRVELRLTETEEDGLLMDLRVGSSLTALNWRGTPVALPPATLPVEERLRRLLDVAPLNDESVWRLVLAVGTRFQLLVAQLERQALSENFWRGIVASC